MAKKKKGIIKTYLGAYSGSVDIDLLGIFQIAILFLLTALTIPSLPLAGLGIFFIIFGLLGYRSRKNKFDYSDKRFWIVFWTDMIVLLIFYVALLFHVLYA